jgi:hypothetical protein
MKSTLATILSVALFVSVTACEKKPKTPLEKVEDKVNDGLDRRPGEKVRDAAEDASDKVKDAVK